MPQVEFEEERNKFTSREIIGQPVTPSTVKFLRRIGLVKDDSQAKYVMFVTILLCFGLTVYVIIRNFTPASGQVNEQLQQELQQKMLERHSLPK
jgi:hypothetical protein